MHECIDTKKIHLEINKNCVKREKFLTQIFFYHLFAAFFTLILERQRHKLCEK